MADPEWVLLAYRLPREPSTPRIAVLRKLRRLGAVRLVDGRGALPAHAAMIEAFDWVPLEDGDARRGRGVEPMRWATRSGCHVDRAACAWLLRRFVDDAAEFVFVDDPDDVPNDATPFDMRGVELSHHGGDCTFETMLRHFSLEDL